MTPEKKQPQKRRSRFKRSPEAYAGFTLTKRDVEILELVHDYGRVESRHILALTPGPRTGITGRIRGLWQLEYLQRAPKGRWRLEILADGSFSGGSSTFVYTLAPRGAAVVAEAQGIPLSELSYDPRISQRSDGMHVEHALEVANFRVCLALACLARPDVELIEWRSEEEIRQYFLASYTDERTGKRINREERRLSPDGYALLRTPEGELNVFVEIDRGRREHTELAKQFLSYWLFFAKKSDYRKSFPNPESRVVLYVSTTPERIAGMRQTLASLDPKNRHGGFEKFWFTTASVFEREDLDKRGRKVKHFVPENLFEAVWGQGPRLRSDDAKGKVDRIRGLL